MSGLIETPAQIWLAVAPVDMRRGLDGLSAIVQQNLGHSPCAGSAFIFQPSRQLITSVAVGWQWRVVVSAAFASGQFCLAESGRQGIRDQSGAVAMVGCWC